MQISDTRFLIWNFSKIYSIEKYSVQYRQDFYKIFRVLEIGEYLCTTLSKFSIRNFCSKIPKLTQRRHKEKNCRKIFRANQWRWNNYTHRRKMRIESIGKSLKIGIRIYADSIHVSLARIDTYRRRNPPLSLSISPWTESTLAQKTTGDVKLPKTQDKYPYDMRVNIPGGVFQSLALRCYQNWILIQTQYPSPLGAGCI